MEGNISGGDKKFWEYGIGVYMYDTRPAFWTSNEESSTCTHEGSKNDPSCLPASLWMLLMRENLCNDVSVDSAPFGSLQRALHT